MRNFPLQIGFGLALALALVAGSAEAHMYKWTTEDGVVSFTDDRDQIPARYVERAVRIGGGSLGSYERFTPQDDAAHQGYAERLRARLEHMRAVNGEATPQRGGRAVAAGTQRTVSVATGNASLPELQVPVADGRGPIVVEPVNAKRSGDTSTRRITVIRQGGETLAVVKSNPNHHNPSTDIYDEEDLEAGDF